MKPIHKFNNGSGATLCNKCSIIISTALTEDILCKKCILIDMTKEDEELSMYEEAFKHKVKAIPKQEILDNRASAYEFIDFDKQETLEEAFEKWSEMQESYDKLDVLRFGAWWQWKRSYNEGDMKEAFIAGGNSQIEEDDAYGSAYMEYMDNWFNKYKNK